MTKPHTSSADSTRRQFLTAAAATPLLTRTGAALARTPDPAAMIAHDLERYIRFGEKRSGGAGDNACGDWMEQALADLGFHTRRQTFSAPYFEPRRCTLSCEGGEAEVWAQPIVVPTPQQGLTAPLVRVDSPGPLRSFLAGAIALVDLAIMRAGRPCSGPAFQNRCKPAFEGGASACVIITNGPTDKTIALNTDGREPLYDAPMALLAPKTLRPFSLPRMQHLRHG
jgi:hypothetical protein